MARNETSVDRLIAEIGELRSQVETLVANGAEGVRETAASVKATADAAAETGEAAAESARGAVRNHPLMSMMGAFALGYSLARVLPR